MGGSGIFKKLKHATPSSTHKLYATKFPGLPNMIYLYQTESYHESPFQYGFQFERYITSDKSKDSFENYTKYYHVHATKICGLTILHRAEIDAISSKWDELSYTEIKNNFIPKSQRAISVFFQMVFSGTSALCHGNVEKKDDGIYNTAFRSVRLPEVFGDLNPDHTKQDYERLANRLKTISSFNSTLKENAQCEIVIFEDERINFIQENESFFALDKVDMIKDLLNM